MITDMKKAITFITMMLLFAAVSAQTVTLTFTGRDASNQYVPLSRMVVSNLTRGWQETLVWPDTVLTMTDGTGIGDVETQNFASLHLSQNNPNPFEGTTYVNLNVTEPGDVSLMITDIIGRIVETLRATSLQTGIHTIRVALSVAGIYFLTARQNGRTASVKMVNGGNGGENAIAIIGTVGANDYLPLPQTKNAPKGTTDNPFVPGDQMQYVGFATFNGEEVESGHVVQEQNGSQTIMLSFAPSLFDSLPCPGASTVTDIDGNSYRTVQLGQQCWMRDNLRVTHYADSTAISMGTADISYSQPYYYNYVSHSLPLEKRGYLYNWPAVMHGAASSETNPSCVQGICPTGWHVPSYAEWTQLTDYVSSRSVFSCDGNSNHIAKALASAEGWESDYDYHQCTVGNNQGANNATGFCAFPAGQCIGNTTFFNDGSVTLFWSSTATNGGNKWRWSLGYNSANVYKLSDPPYIGYSVRCLRD